MDPNIVNEQNKILYKQRNILLVVCSLLLISNIIFGIIALIKSEKTIIIPALKEEVEIQGKMGFSDSYIEQMTLFYIDMLFDLTPDNIDYKSQILLKHVDSKSYHNFVEHYKKEKEKYKKYKLSTKFDITSINILKNGETVEVSGVLSSHFGKGSEAQKQAIFVIGYTKSQGRLLVKTFSEKS